MPTLEHESTVAESLNLEIEQVLRHLIARSQEMDLPDGTLLGVGAQLVFSDTGVRYMSLKSEIDPRVQEILTAQALLRAAMPQCSPDVQRLLLEVEGLLDLAQSLAVGSQTKN